METSAQKKNVEEENIAAEKIISAESKHLLSLRQLEDEYAALLDAYGDRASETPACELTRAKIELAKAEYDRAGAYKFKSFVRRNRKLFEGNGDTPPIIREERDDGAKYVLPPVLENRRYLFVSMSELDRLNKEGKNQAAGDDGLEAVVQAAARAANPSLAESMTFVRYGGNEYLIEFADASEDDLVGFVKALHQEDRQLERYPDLETPPLSITQLSFADVISIMESVEATEPDAQGTDAFEAAAESVSVMTRLADCSLEMEKFITRVNRAVEKIVAAKKGGISYSEAQTFFATYLQKGLIDTGLDSLEKIEALWASGNNNEAYDKTIKYWAVEKARIMFADDRKFLLYMEHLARGLTSEHLSALAAGEAKTPPDFFSTDLKIAKIPNSEYGTSGLREIARKKMAIASRGEAWREVDEIFYAAEAMKRDDNTGLMERSKFFEDLGGEIKEKREITLIFIDLGFLKYFTDAGRRHVGDAALLKAAEIMEEACMESEAECEIYRYGGDEFTIMVHGSREEGQNIQKAIKELSEEAGRIPDLRALREQGFAKDTTGDSRADYAPMELVFNFGIASLGEVEMLVNDMKPEEFAAALAGSRRTKEQFIADLLVKMADATVGHEKAMSRFYELMKMMSQPGYEDENSPVHIRTEAVIAASRKAIFAGLGGEAALRFWIDAYRQQGKTLEDERALKRQIEKFVTNRIEKMSELAAAEQELLDKLVEVHAVRNMLSAELISLREKLEDSEEALEVDEKRIIVLEARLAAAEKAREEIKNARKNIETIGRRTSFMVDLSGGF